MIFHVDLQFSMGAMEVSFGGKIGVYIAHPNFRRKCIEYYHILDIAGKCYDMQLVVIVLNQQRVRLHDPNK
jgi:hypothetical protein